MIYTITFNPALDYIMNVPQYSEGRVNRSVREKLLPGGKGINVSVVLGNLGVESTALGFCAGFTGNEIERLVKERGINVDFVKLKTGQSRINVKLNGKTEINAAGPVIGEADMENLYAKLDKLCDDDILVLAGSVSPDVPDSVYCDILKRLSDKDIRVVVDAEGTLLEKTLECRPFLIKPNHHELGALFDREITTKEAAAECACVLRERGARNVLVSMAGDGAVFVSEDGNVIFCDAPAGEVINPTGAGDSMVAGFLAEFIVSGDYESALKTGVCAGSASAFSHELATRAEVVNLLADGSVCVKKEYTDVGRYDEIVNELSE